METVNMEIEIVKLLINEIYQKFESMPYPSRNIRNFRMDISDIYLNFESNEYEFSGSIFNGNILVSTIKNAHISKEFLQELEAVRNTGYHNFIRKVNEYCQNKINELKNNSGKLNCDRCTGELDESNSESFKRIHDRIYCLNCADILGIYNCCSCDTQTSRRLSQGRRANGNWYCDNCFWDNYIICEECGDTIERDFASFDDYSDRYYCEGCYNDLNRLKEFDSERLDLRDNTFKKLRDTRCFGIELEVDDNKINYDKIQDSTCFGSKYDGSLNCGAEIYSPILQGDKGFEEIKKVCDILKVNNVSRDSGYHLHIDCRDLDWKSIKKIWLCYRILEPMILHILPKDRRTNSYCKKSEFTIRDIVKIKDMDSLWNLWYEDGEDEHETRYRGFNLHSWFNRNTVELRYHTGTVKFEEVINWIKINLEIVQFAIDNDVREILKLLNYNRCKTNYTIIRRIFKQVIKNKSLWKYYKKQYKKHSKKEFGEYYPESNDTNIGFYNSEKVKNSKYKINIKTLEKAYNEVIKNMPNKVENENENEIVLELVY